MSDLKYKYDYEIVFETGYSTHTINPDSIPPYTVGQTIFMNDRYADGSFEEKNFEIMEIKHSYRGFKFVDNNLVQITLGIILKLQEIE